MTVSPSYSTLGWSCAEAVLLFVHLFGFTIAQNLALRLGVPWPVKAPLRQHADIFRRITLRIIELAVMAPGRLFPGSLAEVCPLNCLGVPGTWPGLELRPRHSGLALVCSKMVDWTRVRKVATIDLSTELDGPEFVWSDLLSESFVARRSCDGEFVQGLFIQLVFADISNDQLSNAGA